MAYRVSDGFGIGHDIARKRIATENKTVTLQVQSELRIERELITDATQPT